MRFLFVCIVSILTFVWQAPGATAQAVVHHGKRSGGSYAYGKTRIRYFVFSFNGTLDHAQINRVVSKTSKRIQSDGTTAELKEYSRYNSRGIGRPRVWMELGQILVLGWTGREGNRSGWIAFDTDENWGDSHHRWISSTGESGELRGLGSAHGMPRIHKEVTADFRTGQGRDDYTWIKVYANENRLVWWMRPES